MIKLFACKFFQGLPLLKSAIRILRDYYSFYMPSEIYTGFYCSYFQAKADEIAKLMNENEQLKALIEDLKVHGLPRSPLE